MLFLVEDETFIKKKIAIVGAGWYGCYIAEYLLNNFVNVSITLIDKNDEIFGGSSYNNQNRLHLGFHYPRCSITQQKCKKHFQQFIKQYANLLEDIDKNFYAIANDSKIKHNDFVKLYDNHCPDYCFIKNTFLTNIESDIINTNEKYINFVKTKEHFRMKFLNKLTFINNYAVTKMINENGGVILNDEMIYDKVFNCTYNQFQTTNDVFYEKCLTLIYKKIGETSFDCLTIMDGNYSSLFKYYEHAGDIFYTLTNVQHTPLIVSKNFNDVDHFKDYNMHDKIQLFEDGIMQFYPDFKNNFVHIGHYESFKCKNMSLNDSRDINIDVNENVFSVWCGKISFIFDLDVHINKFMH
jgi:hypothetical protein